MATPSLLRACSRTPTKRATTAGLHHVRLVWKTPKIPLTLAVAHPIRIRTTPSLWCSSPCPTGQKPLFAIGTSDGLYTLEGAGSHWSLSEKPFPSDIPSGRPVPPRKMDSSHALVASVEWLSPNVIASGLKDSSIFVHDLRSGGSATRLQHSHAVAKIRSVDPYRIVVGGINSVFRTAPPGILQKLIHPSSKCTISAFRPTASSSAPIPQKNTIPRQSPTSPSPATPRPSYRTSTCARNSASLLVVSKHPTSLNLFAAFVCAKALLSSRRRSHNPALLPPNREAGPSFFLTDR